MKAIGPVAGLQQQRECNQDLLSPLHSARPVNTTPQMTRFRGAKVCNKWLQERIDDHRIQSDYKYKSELQKEFSTWYYVCVVTLYDNTTDTNDNMTTKIQTDFHTKHMKLYT